MIYNHLLVNSLFISKQAIYLQLLIQYIYYTSCIVYLYIYYSAEKKREKEGREKAKHSTA